MFALDRAGTRHLLMRLGLGFVLGWFGAHEILSPSDWTVFVPGFVSDLSPVSSNDLVLLHGFLLLLASASAVLGLLFTPGSLLASGLLASIVLGLWLDDGIDDLVIRDLGLLALAIALSVDSVRVWHLDGLISRLLTGPGTGPKQSGEIVPRMVAVGSLSTSVLFGIALAVSLVLYESGSGASPGGSVISLTTNQNQPPSATGSSSAPAPAKLSATSVRFDDWAYRQYAYQVYPGELSADTKKALAGFQLSVEDKGASVLIMLKAVSPRYKDAEYTVDKGATAYFVETTMRDDPAGAENNLRDDGVIAVNPQGYILEA